MSPPPASRGFYDRQVERAVARARPLLEPDEEVRGAAPAGRRVRPLYPLLMIGLGAGIFVPGITAPDSALPEAVRLFAGLPLFVAGIALMTWAGQALVIVTGGAVYVVASAVLPGRPPRLVASAPLAKVEVDGTRGVAAVGSERLWPLPFRRRSLLALAALLPGGPPVTGEPPRRRRRLIGIAAGLGILLAVLAVIGAVTETDEEQIEEAVAAYNEGLTEGDGETACAQLTARARRQVVEAATSALGMPPEPPDCAAAVRAVVENAGGRVQEVNSNALLDVEVRDGLATAKAGAPFAHQTLPLVAEDGEWRLADLRRPWTVRDAPASDPPEPVEFAVRAQAVCANVARLAIPVSARLVAGADPQAGVQAGQLRQLARLDAELADRLAGLTLPAGGTVDLEPTLEALREVAELRGGVADAFESGDERELQRLSSEFEPARRRLVEAVRQAGLANALAVCAS
jgi:hypothetical protein